MTFIGKCKAVIKDINGAVLDQFAEVEDDYGNSFSLQKNEYQDRGILPSWENLQHCDMHEEKMLQKKTIKGTTLKD